MSLTVITRSRASALLFGGAALCASASVRAQTNDTIRVAVIPIEAAAEAFFAKEMGFFAKAALDADVQTIQTGPAIAAAIVSNAIDIGYGTLDALAAIHQKGVPFVIIAPASEYLSASTQKTTALVVPATSSVQKARDLSGKVFAVIALSGITHTAARAWIDQNGGDASTVKFVELPFSAMPAALDGGRIDAAWISEPFLSVAKKDGRVLVYGFDAISKHFLTNAWFSAPQWSKDHPGIVRRFARVIRETAVWANKNPDATGVVLAKVLKVDPASISGTARIHYAEQMTPALMQPFIDVSAKYNGFSTFPAQELIYVPSR